MMLLSLALILMIGFLLSGLFKKLKLPGLLGMLLTGIMLGPYVMNQIHPQILTISSELRQIALIVILIRAGLALDLDDLKKVGRPALLMCIVPASFEIAAVTLLAPLFFKISYGEAAILGTVLAAVSPAVIVPRMLKLMENGYGKAKSIPQLVMAGASIDDIYVIILFTSFLEMYKGEDFRLSSLISVPAAVIIGLVIGVVGGAVLTWLFKKLHIRDTIKILIILSTAFVFVSAETLIKPYVPMSGLLAVMALGGMILNQHEVLAKRLSVKYSKIWVGAEMLLFVLVGAAVNITYIGKAGVMAAGLILAALIVRMSGVWICMLKTNLSPKEKLFCGIAYLPKATVQAAIGGIPLISGVAAGEVILAAAVIAIIITAPIGAIGIDLTWRKLLSK